jgi:hypothetical protein
MATVLAIAVVGQEIRRLEICKERVQYARREERRQAEVKEGGGRGKRQGRMVAARAKKRRARVQAAVAARWKQKQAEAVLVRLVQRWFQD